MNKLLKFYFLFVITSSIISCGGPLPQNLPNTEEPKKEIDHQQLQKAIEDFSKASVVTAATTATDAQRQAAAQSTINSIDNVNNLDTKGTTYLNEFKIMSLSTPDDYVRKHRKAGILLKNTHGLFQNIIHTIENAQQEISLANHLPDGHADKAKIISDAKAHIASAISISNKTVIPAWNSLIEYNRIFKRGSSSRVDLKLITTLVKSKLNLLRA